MTMKFLGAEQDLGSSTLCVKKSFVSTNIFLIKTFPGLLSRD